MSLDRSIFKLKKISFLLFLLALLALIGSLSIHNILVGNNFERGFDFKDNLKAEKDSSFEMLLIGCDNDIDGKNCFPDERYHIFSKKFNTRLDQCFKFFVNPAYRYNNILYPSAEVFTSATGDNINRTLDNKFKKSNLYLVLSANEKKNPTCIKNSSKYNFYKIFPFYYELIFKVRNSGITLGTSKPVNPFIYGEVSISNLVKRYPINLIFKSLLFISSLLMFFYWKYNNDIFKNIISAKKNLFFTVGACSAIFLFLHVLFLGVEFETKIFNSLRKSLILFFIFFEVLAQMLLTNQLYKNIEKLKNYCNIFFLKLKVIFVCIVFIVTIVVFSLLIYLGFPKKFEYIAEWNYFSGLIFYYFLSYLMWKNKLLYPTTT